MKVRKSIKTTIKLLLATGLLSGAAFGAYMKMDSPEVADAPKQAVQKEVVSMEKEPEVEVEEVSTESEVERVNILPVEQVKDEEITPRQKLIDAGVTEDIIDTVLEMTTPGDINKMRLRSSRFYAPICNKSHLEMIDCMQEYVKNAYNNDWHMAIRYYNLALQHAGFY